MTQDETNGFLRALLAQVLALESALTEVEGRSVLNDAAYAAVKKAKADLDNVYMHIRDARGWNSP